LSHNFGFIFFATIPELCVDLADRLEESPIFATYEQIAHFDYRNCAWSLVNSEDARESTEHPVVPVCEKTELWPHALFVEMALSSPLTCGPDCHAAVAFAQIARLFVRASVYFTVDDSLWTLRAAQRALSGAEPYFQSSYGTEAASMARFCSVITIVPLFEILARWSTPRRNYKPHRLNRKKPLPPTAPEPWTVERLRALVSRHVRLWQHKQRTLIWNNDMPKLE